MANQGTFVIRKDGRDKSLCVPSHAEPIITAPNVIYLIRNVDLGRVFNNLTELEHSKYFWFDAQALETLSEKGTPQYYKDNKEFIMDSLICEYGYVVNLDDEVLEFYVGAQKRPQSGNRYGERITYTSENGENYYPCRLVARFTFRYIRSALSRAIINDMEKSMDRDTAKLYDVQDKEEIAKNAEEPELKPTLVNIYMKLDWIQNRIVSTFDKQIDMTARYDQALRDIERIKEELSVYKIEIGQLQFALDKHLREH